MSFSAGYLRKPSLGQVSDWEQSDEVIAESDGRRDIGDEEVNARPPPDRGGVYELQPLDPAVYPILFSAQAKKSYAEFCCGLAGA
jgi:hypothetical protein